MFEPPYDVLDADVSLMLTPSLLVYRDLVEKNIDTLIAMVRGESGRLRPHCKTHKMPGIIRMLESRGVTKHKCATISEAEMLARCGARDVLLAYPLVGPNVARFVSIILNYPEVIFRATVENRECAHALSNEARHRGLGLPIPVLVDLDVGMNRTGTQPSELVSLYTYLTGLNELEPDGLHVYDGHLRDSEPVARCQRAHAGLEIAIELRSELKMMGLRFERIVIGGTPSFPSHASCTDPGVECSPGTLILHDHGYASQYPDLPFLPAALLLTRVISRPCPGTLCLDLGHKAVAADPQGDRIRLLDVEGSHLGPQSEEHLIVYTKDAKSYRPGRPLLAIPTHICPTCALHREAIVLASGRAVDRWEVTARDRVLGV